jgi:integrase
MIEWSPMPLNNYKYVHRVTLPELYLDGRPYKNFPVLMTDRGEPFFIPFLFVTFLMTNGYVYKLRGSREGDMCFGPSYISQRTIESYISSLHRFLDVLEEYTAKSIKNGKARHTVASADNIHLVDVGYVSNYINRYLPQFFGSFATLRSHQSALQAFFDWSKYYGFHDGLTVMLRHWASQGLGTSRKNKFDVTQYISREFRKQLLLACDTQRDRLILRCGHELGLRRQENLALVLGDQIIKGKKKAGLLALFYQLEKQTTRLEFEYWMNGIYCKGGKSRPVLIPRPLLEAMFDYYQKERDSKLRERSQESDHLFVNYSLGERVEISIKYPSKLFKVLREKIPYLNQGLSYHDLRHTFATELYSHLVRGERMRSEKRALTIVQDRLGHASLASTQIYIHLFEQMQEVERSDDDRF